MANPAAGEVLFQGYFEVESVDEHSVEVVARQLFSSESELMKLPLRDLDLAGVDLAPGAFGTLTIREAPVSPGIKLEVEITGYSLNVIQSPKSAR